MKGLSDSVVVTVQERVKLGEDRGLLLLAETSMRADAWATAFQVLGPERGMAIAERLNLPVLFVIERDGQFEERACCAFQRYRKQELS